MTGAVVQTGYAVDDSGATSTTIAVTLTGVVAGNTLYAHVGGTDTGAVTASVSDGSAFSAGDTKRRSTGDNQSGWTFYRENVGAGSHTITATFSGAIDFRRLRVGELSGLATSSSKDQAVGQVQASPGTGANGISSSATAATTNANDFVIGSTQDADSANPGSGTLTAGTGYTISGTNVIMGIESKSVAATGAQTATFTQSVAGSRITHVIAFKEASTDVTGTLAETLGALVSSGAGAVDVTGSLAKTLGNLVASGAGAVNVDGSLAQTLGALTVAGVGAVGDNIEGTLAKTLGALTSAGSGAVSVDGQGAVTLGALTSAGAGAVAIDGTLAKTLGQLVAAGIGDNGGGAPAAVDGYHVIEWRRRGRR